MTKREFQKKVKEENLKMISYDLVYDAVYSEPHIMGCAKSDGRWKIYMTSERTGKPTVMVEFDNENDAYDKFYKLVKAQIELENRT